MAIRRPPDDYIPRIVRRGGQPPPRVIRYEEPPRSFWRRVLAFLMRPYVAIPALVIFCLCATVLVYYWVVFSARIDNLLQGEVFTRSAGIYAAPKQIRAGQNISQEDLIAYLKRAGYVERGQQAEVARGRYAIDGSSVEVQPGSDTMVDNARTFEPLKIQFARDTKSVAGIANKNTGGRVDRAQLEPELISSVTGRERAKRRVIGFNDLPPHLVKAITVTEDRAFLNITALTFAESFAPSCDATIPIQTHRSLDKAAPGSHSRS